MRIIHIDKKKYIDFFAHLYRDLSPVYMGGPRNRFQPKVDTIPTLDTVSSPPPLCEIDEQSL